MADGPVFECTLRRTKAQLRLHGKSKVLGKIFADNYNLSRRMHQRIRDALYDNPIPIDFWSEALGNEDGYTIQLSTPIPSDQLEHVLESIKTAVTRFLREYATPYEATITIVRGEL